MALPIDKLVLDGSHQGSRGADDVLTTVLRPSMKAKPPVAPKILEPVVKPVTHMKRDPVDISISDQLCVQVETSACTAIEDMCALIHAAPHATSIDPSFCAGAQDFCANQALVDPTASATVDAKFCLKLKASTELCAAAKKACAPGSKAAGSAFCTRVQTLCTA